MIEITDLQKSYGSKRAIDIARYSIYSIADGDMLGLVGNNGAGKTTLFRLILDLVKADTGTVAIAGTDVTRTEDWKDITGAYIDDGFLIDYLTPEEYFYFIGRTSPARTSTTASSSTTSRRRNTSTSSAACTDSARKRWTNASAPSSAS